MIPRNWKLTTLEKVAHWSSGGTPSRKYPEYYQGSIPWVKTGELNDDYLYDTEEKITQDAIINSNAKILPINTIILAMYGATIGKTAILGIEAATNQACACAIPLDELNYKFLFYFLRSQKDNFILRSQGGAQSNISQTIIKKFSIPLPPLDEQKRIVDIIENLFAKLDRAKALAQNVIDNYELRRSAILHKAFTGQLTNPDLNDWKIFSWESCIKKMQNGISKRNGDTGDEIIVLRLYDIKNNEINLSNARTISLNDKEQENYLLKINDLLMIRVNGSKDNVGKQLLIKSSEKLAFCDHLIRIQYVDEIFPKYMLYFSQCKDYKDYVLANIVSSAGQNTISRKGMTNLNIPIPNIDEQKEIVRILDSLLAKEQQTKELAEQSLQHIDLMKKSILARAFRGKLKSNELTAPKD